jgi:predicted esterase
MLARTGSLNLCGFFLSGINEDRLSDAYRNYKPGGNFLDTPVWLSSGMNDHVATTGAHDQVSRSLQRTGFKRVRLERFAGGHQLKKSEVQRALRWFRELGQF